MTIDEIYEAADAIELVMETKPLRHGWTPSVLARAAHISTVQAYEVLAWMVREVYITKDERGSWSHYYRRH